MKKVLTMILCLALLMTGCAGRKTAQGETQAPQTTPTTLPPETKTTEPATEPVTEPPETEPPAPETTLATALADRTYLVLELLQRDDTVEIAGEYDETYYVVKMEQGYGLIEKRLIRLEDEASYEKWGGYTYYNAEFYNNYHLRADGVQKLSSNTQVQVLDDLGECLVVEYGGSIGYMLEDDISRNYIQPAPSSGNNNSGTGGADGGDISLEYYGGISKLAILIPQSGDVTGKGTVLVNDAELILGWFDRGDSVSIIAQEGFLEEMEGWYSVYLEGMCGYVRQNLLLEEGKEPYEQWDGFARSQASVYDNYFLSGNPVTKLSTNTNIQVLCDLDDCYLVQVGEVIGYMEKAQISESKIVYSGGGGGTEDSGGDWTPPVL